VRERDPEHVQKRDLSYPPLPVPLTVGTYDNHTHLEIADGENPLDYLEQLDRASSVGIRGVVQVGGDLETSRWSAEMAAKEPRMLAAVAIHPNEAPRYEAAGELDAAAREFLDLAAASNGADSAHYRLRAAEMLRESGDLDAAARAIEEIRRDLSLKFDTQYVDDNSVPPAAIQVIRQGGGSTLRIAYEKRVPFLYNLDIVGKFDKSVSLNGAGGE
jgi:hypothetical protein